GCGPRAKNEFSYLRHCRDQRQQRGRCDRRGRRRRCRHFGAVIGARSGESRAGYARGRRRRAGTAGPAMTAIAVTIAGSDSGGGAGIQADLKTFGALGVYGASVIVALTAQNTKGVTGIHDVPADFIRAQMDAVFSDLAVDAVKIGMLSQTASIETVAKGLSDHRGKNIVLGPVMVATSGDKLLASDAIDALRNLLIPRALVITPNLSEAARPVGRPTAAAAQAT